MILQSFDSKPLKDLLVIISTLNCVQKYKVASEGGTTGVGHGQTLAASVSKLAAAF